MLPKKFFKIRIFNLAENEFQTTKFPDFSLTFVWNSVANSLTFPGFPGQWQPCLQAMLTSLMLKLASC